MAKKCPVCKKGDLVPGEVKEEMFGVSLGTYPADVCTECGESYVDGETMDAIESKAKELGLWGLAKKVTVRKSGNSLVVSIPADVARFLHLRGGEDVLLRPEAKRRLVLEIS
ncbi:MAG: YgiT-type zinc finger protein [Thermoplasmata archaeon]